MITFLLFPVASLGPPLFFLWLLYGTVPMPAMLPLFILWTLVGACVVGTLKERANIPLDSGPVSLSETMATFLMITVVWPFLLLVVWVVMMVTWWRGR